MNFINDNTDDFMEFYQETINLESEQIASALQISQETAIASRQWQIYLQNLALSAFREWLLKRAPQINTNFHPKYENFIDAIVNLEVEKFKFCLLTTIDFTESEITLPRAVVDLPEFAAHFYVVVAIDEELEVAAITGFLRYDELVKYHAQLQPEKDWNYHIPLDLFNTNTNEILLYLQCLETTGIALPEIPVNRQINILDAMRLQLFQMLPQLNNHPLWQSLSWEQGIIILTTPNLFNWVNRHLNQNKLFADYLSELLQILAPPAINMRYWLSNKIDNVIQENSWQALQLPALLSTTVQTPEQDLQNIITDIQLTHAIEIPDFSSRGYRDILLENLLRIYTVSWSLIDNEGWCLLLILKVAPGNYSDSRFRLQVSDQNGILASEELQANQQDEYIFSFVEGSYEDRMFASIISDNGQIRILQPFAFYEF